MYPYILCIVITYKFTYKESLYSEITAVIALEYCGNIFQYKFVTVGKEI